MRTALRIESAGLVCYAFAALLLLAGCAAPTKQNGEHFATKYRATDGRTVNIGPRTPADGGWSFKEPHMDKCWIAAGFDFRGYDTLLIMPTLAAVQVQTPEEGYDLEDDKEDLAVDLGLFFFGRNSFTNIAMHEEEVVPRARVLKLETIIFEFKKGSFAGRQWGGLFGAGQPVLRVVGIMTDGDKTVFTFETHRSGDSIGERLDADLTEEQIQFRDISGISLDVTDFAKAIAGEYRPKN